jgi:hypothetical protein
VFLTGLFATHGCRSLLKPFRHFAFYLFREITAARPVSVVERRRECIGMKSINANLCKKAS